MKLRTRRNNDERGAILVLSAVGLVLAMIAGGLAVDLGFMAQDARRNQKVADMAALDAVRVLPNDPTSAARTSACNPVSAARPGNDFPCATAGHSVVVEWSAASTGPWSTSPADLANATAVRVSATSTHRNRFPFVPDGQSVTRRAVASATARAGFSIGSALGTVDTNRSTILNAFIGRIIRGSNLSAGLVSWQGLVSGNVTLEALRRELATMGFSAGTVDEMLDANLTLSQLLQATAQALTAQGPTGASQATVLNTLRTQITATTLTQFKLGRFITVQQGADDMALASTVNVFQLVTAGAQAANGTNFIDVDPLDINVPGVASTKARLKVIELPQFYFGPVGGSVSTSQLELTLTPKLDLPITVTGLTGTRVKNELPIKITGAGATGTLTDVSCGTPSTMTVTVDPRAFAGSAATSLDVYADVPTLGNVPVLRIPTTSVVPTTNGGPSAVVFDYPSEFPPPLGTETTKHVGSQPVGLNGIMDFTPGTPVVLNAIAAPLADTIVTTTMNALSPLVGQVDNRILTPLLSALGLDIGSADVTARALRCGTPTLVD